MLQALALLLGACSNLPRLTEQEWRLYPEHVELNGVPYYPQDRYQCGPQSLAMMLSYSGIETRPEALVDSVYVPGKKGSFAVELRAAARTHGRLPYKIETSLQHLAGVLAEGYPVLVMQNLGLGFAPKWHFAVTIGFDRSEDSFILRTGANPRLLMTSTKFSRRWRLADNWAIIMLGPEDFPEWLEKDQYENQLALLEQSWAPYMESIYNRMRSRWPGSSMAALGLGNIAYKNEKLDEAAAYYQSTLKIDQDHIAAMHNLARIYFDRKNYMEAGSLVCRAKKLAKDHPLQSFIENLEQELKQVYPGFVCPDPVH